MTLPSDSKDESAPQRASSEDRRREIAAAAREILVEKGFDGLRTRQIADRVGINIATLHYHVPTKQALIELVAQSLMDEFIASYEAVDRTGFSPADCLRLELADHGELHFERPEIAAIFSELGARARVDTAIRSVMARMREAWLCHIRQILEAGIRSGDFRSDLDPVAAAVMITGALLGSQSDAAGGRVGFEALIEEIMRSVSNPSSSQ